jgi:NAD(P)H-flavin reductase
VRPPITFRGLEKLVLTVTNLRRATPSTRIVRLSLGGARFTYAAGQVALLGIPGQAARMPYSIASAPDETTTDGYLEFLLRMESGGWGAHLAGLRRGSEMVVQGPLGTFVLPRDPEEREFLFVAGGTGIAPLRSMISQALLTRQRGKLHLLYSARTPLDFAYLSELKRHARHGRLELALTATREVPPRWRGERGRITSDHLARLVESPETLCFVCGPAAMVDDVPRMLVELGIERKRIRIEDW